MDFDYFDRDKFAEIFDEKFTEEVNPSCEHDQIIYQGSFVCVKCGEVDINKNMYYENLNNNIKTFKQYFMYNRKSHFKLKLRQFTGMNQSVEPEYLEIINDLKTREFNTIFELKKLMKSLGYKDYYDYIYNIYYTIKKVNLINLNNNDIDFLAGKFLIFQREFKKSSGCKRNIFSYNTLIFALLFKYNYPCHKHVLLPKNYRKVLTKIFEMIN